MNSSTSTSVEEVVPSLDIIIGSDRLSVDDKELGGKVFVLIHWLLTFYQLMKDGGGRLQL